MFRLLFLVFVFYTSLLSAQTEEEQIRTTIDGYIVGTAYNDSARVSSAFLPGARMFLDHKDKPLFLMTIEEYAGRLARHKPGIYNGRTTNILSIDRFAGIATAKLEVLIPGLDRRFIDLLLLKKFGDEWKIISKTAASETAARTTERVLLVLSNADHQGTSDLPAGNSFSEIVIAYAGYQAAGYHVEMVSPLGGSVPLAYINPADSLQAQYLYDADFLYALEHTRKPDQINPADYQIIQFTGGSAPIFDLPENTAIQQIAMHIYEQNQGVIAAVCHGTAALVNLKTMDGNFLIAGKRVNGVPDGHENKQLPHYQHYPFIIEEKLTARGGKFFHAPIGTPHVETDGRLVTGQNSLSSKLVTRRSIEILQERQE